MGNLIFMLSLLFIEGIGLIKLRAARKKMLQDIHFADKFRTDYIEFYYDSMGHHGLRRKHTAGHVIYHWLTQNMDKMQGLLGRMGLITYIDDRIGPIHEYPIIINTLPKFRTGKITKEEEPWIDEIINRYIGIKKEEYNKLAKEIYNPIILFREGMRVLVNIPVTIFNWLGLLSDQAAVKIKKSWLVRLITSIAAIVTFLSGVVTIVSGWDQVTVILQRAFK